MAIDGCKKARKIKLTTRVMWRGESSSNHVVEERESILLIARWPTPKQDYRVRMDVQ
jgi:hypothetical protein